MASAWAGAEPGKRWVRIEALWGIPESLYWHSHDTFEVDTEKADLASGYDKEFEYPIRHRERFKGLLSRLTLMVRGFITKRTAV